MRRLLPIAILAVVVVGLIALGLRDEDPQVPTGPGDSSPSDDSGSEPGPSPAVGHGILLGTVSRGGEGIAASLSLRLHTKEGGRDELRGAADARGRYTIEGVPAGGHLLTVSVPDGPGRTLAVKFPWGVEPHRVDVELPAGGIALNGRAVHQNGSPFRGRVGCRQQSTGIRQITKTDPEGRFAFVGLVRGRAIFSAEAEGSLGVSGQKVAIPHAGEFLFVVDAGTRAIRGLVLAAGADTPIPGAAVTARSWRDGGSIRAYAVTDENGRFAMRAPVSENSLPELEVRAEGYWLWQAEEIAWRPEYEVHLERSARLTVRVVSSADGSRVRGAPVEMEYDTLEGGWEEVKRITDDSGRVVFDVVPSFLARVSVKGNGWLTDPEAAENRPGPIRTPPGEHIEVEHRVVRSARIEVRVLSSEGELLPRSHVAYTTASVRGGSLAEDGTLVLSDIRAGAVALRARYFALESPDYSARVEPGEIHRADLVIPAGAYLVLDAVDRRTGEKIENVRLRFRPEGKLSWRATFERKAGPFPPGRQEIAADHPEYREVRTFVELLEARDYPIRLQLERGLEIRGRLLFPDGRPVDHGRVGWYGDLRGPDGKIVQYYDERRGSRVGEGGAFRLAGLPSGDLRLYCSRSSMEGKTHQAHPVIPAGSTDVDVVLEETAAGARREELPTLEMTLLDPAGNPVPTADWSARGRTSDGAEWEREGTFTDGRQWIELEGQPVEMTIEVHGARTHTGYPLPLGSARVGPVDPRKGPIEIRLPDELVIRGVVLDPDGRGLADVRVWAALPVAEDEYLEHRRWETLTDESGGFLIGGLGSGEARILIDVPEGCVLANPPLVSAGGRDVVVRLSRVASARVTVLDPARQPVSDAWVGARGRALKGEGGWIPETSWDRTDTAGVAELTDLIDSRPYDLVVYSSPKRRDLAPAKIEGWVPETRTVRLTPGFTVRGTILGVDAQPVPKDKVRVWVWTEVTGWWWVQTGDGGTFEATGLAEGPVGLTLRSVGCLPHDTPAWQEPGDLPHVEMVSAGASGVVLYYPPRK